MIFTLDCNRLIQIKKVCIRTIGTNYYLRGISFNEIHIWCTRRFSKVRVGIFNNWFIADLSEFSDDWSRLFEFAKRNIFIKQWCCYRIGYETCSYQNSSIADIGYASSWLSFLHGVPSVFHSILKLGFLIANKFLKIIISNRILVPSLLILLHILLVVSSILINWFFLFRWMRSQYFSRLWLINKCFNRLINSYWLFPSLSFFFSSYLGGWEINILN